MYYTGDALLPDNQEKLIITAASLDAPKKSH
jgi:hypothetical protein